MRRILAMAHKEMLHILRDPRSLAVAVLMPLMMLLLFGYALDMELKEIPLAILDQDRSVASRELIRQVTGGEFIADAGRLQQREEIERGFRRGRFRAALVIPAGHGVVMAQGGRAKLQLLVDGADATTAEQVDNYLTMILRQVNRKAALSAGAQALPGIDARLRFFFNQNQTSAAFIVPGLAALILMMICALLTSVAIAREKETGTMEQILTTPVSAGQVVIGKVIPYVLIGVLDAALVLLLGVTVFQVPMEGSWLVLSGYSFLFLLIALALGLLISTITRSQQVAMILALMITFLPTLILSGFIFPLESMPVLLQWASRVIPATYYITVIRGVMLAGEAWYPLEAGVMAGMALLLLAAAVHRFGERLD